MGDGTYGAIVLGSGPAGSSAAYHLSRCGLKDILVIERLSDERFSNYHSICGEAVSDRSMKAAGLECDAVRRIDAIEISFSGDIRARIPVKGSIIDRPSFLNGLISESGAERIHVTARKVTFSDGMYRVDLGDRIVSAPMLIGADGAHSVVRRDLFGTRPEEMVPIENCLLPGESDGVLRFTVSERMKGAYEWRFPSHDGMVSVGSVCGWDRPEGVVSKGARHIPIGKVPEVSDGIGCCLVGDAAGLPNPLCSGGIGAALISGRKAAEALSSGMPDLYSDFIRKDRMFDPRFMEVHRTFEGWTDAEIADAMSPFRNGYSVPRGLYAMIRRPSMARVYFGCWMGFRIGW